MQVEMMFTHLDDLPETAKSIDNMLGAGWHLFSLTAHQAIFTRFDEDDVERFAIRLAKGNNGGEWATHYTEEQKNVWRNFAKDLFRDVLGTRGKSVETPS